MFDIENINQILERQCASIEFRDGKVKYFSLSTQHDTADTVYEAIENIVIADEELEGKTPIGYIVDKRESKLEISPLDFQYDEIEIPYAIDRFFKSLNTRH